jgi:hypothetical protein
MQPRTPHPILIDYIYAHESHKTKINTSLIRVLGQMRPEMLMREAGLVRSIMGRLMFSVEAIKYGICMRRKCSIIFTRAS